MNEQARETAARGKLRAQGYILKYSKIHGGYLIINEMTNCIETSDRYDMTLDDVENFITS